MSTPDYLNLLDAPMWDFIRQSYACYPEDTARRSIGEQRAIYDGMCRAFHVGYPPGVMAQDETLGAVRCRRYHGAQPGAGPKVIYLHGGGYSLGGLNSHDDICAEICGRTGFQVISVDYRLAPEHLHPAAHQDALAVTRAIAATGPYLLVGDSAGGGLAATVAHVLRHNANPPKGLVLIYPGLGGDPDQGSYLTHAEAPMLTRENVLHFSGVRFAGAAVPLNDPTANVLQENDFSDLPPVVTFCAECDPLADDGREYCARITAAGGRATWHLEKGMVHGALRARHMAPAATACFDRIVAAIAELGSDP
jgi:acetyl esterase